jgi:hypothetical protein
MITKSFSYGLQCMVSNGTLWHRLGVEGWICHFSHFFLSSLTCTLVPFHDYTISPLHYCVGKQYHWVIFKRVPGSLPRANVSRGPQATLTT